MLKRILLTADLTVNCGGRNFSANGNDGLDCPIAAGGDWPVWADLRPSRSPGYVALGRVISFLATFGWQDRTDSGKRFGTSDFSFILATSFLNKGAMFGCRPQVAFRSPFAPNCESNGEHDRTGEHTDEPPSRNAADSAEHHQSKGNMRCVADEERTKHIVNWMHQQ